MQYEEKYIFPKKSKTVLKGEPNQYIFVGIDYGNTYSSISCYDPQTHQIEMIKDKKGLSDIPTYESFPKNKSGKIRPKFGRDAKNDTSISTKLFGAKMFLGKKYDESLGIFKDRKFNFKSGIGRNFTSGMTVNFDDGKTIQFTAEEVSGLFINYLKRLLETNYPNRPIGGVCITVPVGFNEYQKCSLIDACEIAGFDRNFIRIITFN